MNINTNILYPLYIDNVNRRTHSIKLHTIISNPTKQSVSLRKRILRHKLHFVLQIMYHYHHCTGMSLKFQLLFYYSPDLCMMGIFLHCKETCFYCAFIIDAFHPSFKFYSYQNFSSFFCGFWQYKRQSQSPITERQ